MSVHHLKINNPRWQRLRRRIKARDGYRCVSCGAAGRLEVDHVQPLHQGGAMYDPTNLQCLCRRCHLNKTARENRKDPERQRWADYLQSLL